MPSRPAFLPVVGCENQGALFKFLISSWFNLSGLDESSNSSISLEFSNLVHMVFLKIVFPYSILNFSGSCYTVSPFMSDSVNLSCFSLLVNRANNLSILFIFSKIQILDLLILCFYLILLFFIISYHLLDLGLFCFHFSKFLKFCH